MSEAENRPLITDHRALISRQDFFGAIGAALLTIIFCMLLLTHDSYVFWNDDYQISVLPVCADIARAWNHGEFPLLSPYSWICGNLAGEFQYGVFSIFINALIIVIWKLPLTFPQQAAALSIAHLAVLSAGAFLLARQRLARFARLDKTGGSPIRSQNQAAHAHAIRESRIASSRPLMTGDNRGLALSIFVALVTSLSGWIICWGASDWLGALGAFTWLPWCWLAAERALDPARSRWRFLWPAPFVYLLITGGFPYTVLMLALVLAWLLAREIFQVGAIDLNRPAEGGSESTITERKFFPEPSRQTPKSNFDKQIPGRPPPGGSMNRPYLRRSLHQRGLTRIMPLLIGVALGVGLSAPAWLALFNYIQGSARAVQNPSAHFQWLVPWNAWPGLILPAWTVDWTNFWTQHQAHRATELACGLIAPSVLIAGFIFNGRALLRKIRWEFALLVIVFILAMTPTAGVFRWSFRWLPLFHLVLALCAAEVLQFTAGNAVFAELKLKKKFSAFSAVNPPVIAFILVLVVMLAAKIFNVAGEYLFPFTWILLALAFIWWLAERFFPRASWIPAAATFASLLATYFSLPTNCGVPKFNLSQSLLEREPLDPNRLYLSVYPPPETSYRSEAKPDPIGQVVRPGSTSMWAGLRFVNGYSPIRPAGAAREFASSIHGEVDPSLADWLLAHDANAGGLLAQMGIDGIIVAREFSFAPKPAGEWNMAFSNDEASVYLRRGAAFPLVRAMDQSVEISDIVSSRNSVGATIQVPPGEKPAKIAFSRPFFPGYIAKLNGHALPVSSTRDLFPSVEVPAGMGGRLSLIYRPAWLIGGAIIALASAAIWIGSALNLFLTNHRS